MTKKLKILYLLIILCIASTLLNSCKSQYNADLPNFELYDINNVHINSDTLKHKTLVINFWATSCSSCIKEMPDMVKFYNLNKKKLGDKFEMLAIAMPYDNPMYVKNFAISKKLPFIVGMDVNNVIVGKFIDINLTPSTLIFVNGKRKQKIIGVAEWRNILQ